MNTRLLTLLALIGLAACAKAPPQPQYDTTLNMKELMGHVVDPGAWAVWRASGEIDTQQGTESLAPKTEVQWEAAESGAAEVAEAGNLLLLPGRAHAEPAWSDFARQLTKTALAAKAAAEAHDEKRLYDTGAAVYQVCTACHAKYVMPFQPKPGKGDLPDWPDDVKRAQKDWAQRHPPGA